jgi:hypothetical protein
VVDISSLMPPPAAAVKAEPAAAAAAADGAVVANGVDGGTTKQEPADGMDVDAAAPEGAAANGAASTDKAAAADAAADKDAAAGSTKDASSKDSTGAAGKEGNDSKDSKEGKESSKPKELPPPSVALTACRVGNQLLEPHAFTLSGGCGVGYQSATITGPDASQVQLGWSCSQRHVFVSETDAVPDCAPRLHTHASTHAPPHTRPPHARARPQRCWTTRRVMTRSSRWSWRCWQSPCTSCSWPALGRPSTRHCWPAGAPCARRTGHATRAAACTHRQHAPDAPLAPTTPHTRARARAGRWCGAASCRWRSSGCASGRSARRARRRSGRCVAVEGCWADT